MDPVERGCRICLFTEPHLPSRALQLQDPLGDEDDPGFQEERFRVFRMRRGNLKT